MAHVLGGHELLYDGGFADSRGAQEQDAETGRRVRVQGGVGATVATATLGLGAPGAPQLGQPLRTAARAVYRDVTRRHAFLALNRVAPVDDAPGGAGKTTHAVEVKLRAFAAVVVVSRGLPLGGNTAGLKGPRPGFSVAL